MAVAAAYLIQLLRRTVTVGFKWLRRDGSSHRPMKPTAPLLQQGLQGAFCIPCVSIWLYFCFRMNESRFDTSLFDVRKGLSLMQVFYTYRSSSSMEPNCYHKLQIESKRASYQ